MGSVGADPAGGQQIRSAAGRGWGRAAAVGSGGARGRELSRGGRAIRERWLAGMDKTGFFYLQAKTYADGYAVGTRGKS